MATRKIQRLGGLFFCSLSIVYAGSAMGADGLDGATPLEPLQAQANQLQMPADAQPPARGGAVMQTVAPQEPLPQGQQVKVGSFGQIDLHVKDLDLTKVLQLLSIESKRNIIASRSVAGTVSADLYGVDFYEALDAILQANGYGYVEEGNFIYVYTAEELQRLEEAKRKQVTRVYRLNYMPATEALAFVTPLASPAGSIAVSSEVPGGMEPTLDDNGANSFAHADTLVIRDYPENVEEIIATLQQLDVRPKQVLIESTILQARLSEVNAFGVDFAIFTDLNVTDFTTPLGAVDDLIAGIGEGGSKIDSGGAITANPGNVAQGQSTIKLGIMGDDVAVFIRALDTVTDTTVLATPKVLVLNRQRAHLLVGEKLGYLSTTATDTSTTQTVEFLEVGTRLTVRPFVSDDGFIRMELKPSVSDGETRLTGGFVIPDETTQELTTNVIVHSGQTVVLGGLFKEDTTVDRRQVPGLGSIPIVGNAFRGQDDDIQRSEVIFLIKPTILKDQALYAAGERAADNIELARLGTRQQLLPWSKTKLSSTHVKKAYDYLREGNQDKALWHTNLALYISPSDVDALRLKEQITGEQFVIPERGILNDAIDAMIQRHMEDATPADQAEPAGDAQEPQEEPADTASADAPAATQPSATDATEQMGAEEFDAMSQSDDSDGASAAASGDEVNVFEAVDDLVSADQGADTP